jgi:hypothetical protein
MLVGQETQQRAGGEFGREMQQGGVGLASCTARFFVCPTLAYIGVLGFPALSEECGVYYSLLLFRSAVFLLDKAHFDVKNPI